MEVDGDRSLPVGVSTVFCLGLLIRKISGFGAPSTCGFSHGYTFIKNLLSRCCCVSTFSFLFVLALHYYFINKILHQTIKKTECKKEKRKLKLRKDLIDGHLLLSRYVHRLSLNRNFLVHVEGYIVLLILLFSCLLQSEHSK